MSVDLVDNPPKEGAEALKQQVEVVLEHVLVKSLAAMMENLLATTSKEQNPGQGEMSTQLMSLP